MKACAWSREILTRPFGIDGAIDSISEMPDLANPEAAQVEDASLEMTTVVGVSRAADRSTVLERLLNSVTENFHMKNSS